MQQVEQKVQLTHPAGKKGIGMDAVKYNALKKAILHYLKQTGGATHTEIWKAVEEDVREGRMKFEGNVHWHLEWVKLDLEANKLIERVPKTSPQKYIIVKNVS